MEFNLPDYFSFFDYAVFLGLTFISVVFAFLKRLPKAQVRSMSVAEYLLMGRRLTLPLFVATLVTTWYGDVFGVTHIAFQQGIYNIITQGVFWYISYILFAVFFVHKIRKHSCLSLPELVGQIYGQKASFISALCIFFHILPFSYALGAAMVLNLLWGLSIPTSCGIVLFCTILYCLRGGFSSIVISDAFQFVLMYLAGLSVLLFSVHQYGGLSFLKDHLPENHLHVLGYLGLNECLVWFFIAFSTTFIHPTFYQRCLAANSPKTAFRGILVAIFFWALFDICTTALGLYAKAIFPDASPLSAPLQYAFHILPEGFRGLFMAGFLAAILSTLDSFLFMAATLLTYDLLPKKYLKNIWIHRLGLCVTGLITWFCSIQITGNLEGIFRTINGSFTAILAPPIFMGLLFPNRLPAQSFFWMTFSSALALLFWHLCKPVPIDPFYAGFLVNMSVSFFFLIFSERPKLFVPIK